MLKKLKLIFSKLTNILNSINKIINFKKLLRVGLIKLKENPIELVNEPLRKQTCVVKKEGEIS